MDEILKKYLPLAVTVVLLTFAAISDEPRDIMILVQDSSDVTISVDGQNDADALRESGSEDKNAEDSYRERKGREDDSGWTYSSPVTTNGTFLGTELTDLKPCTEYEVQASTSPDFSDAVTTKFKTLCEPPG